MKDNSEIDPSAKPASVPPRQTDLDVEAQKILDENQKHNTSGLSWDEVAQRKDGWNRTTDMGEGD